MMRTADSASATVTSNKNAEEYTVVKNQATGADSEVGPDYEMIPAVPPRKKEAPGYFPGSVDVTTNTNVTSVIGNRSSGGIAINPQYAAIHTFSNAGPSTNVYEMLELVDTQTNGTHYKVPSSPSHQETDMSTGHDENALLLYAMPRDPEVAQMTGVPPQSSTNLYNVPRNKQGTTTADNPQPTSATQAKRHDPYNHLEILPPPPPGPPNTTTRESEPSTAGGATKSSLTTYDVPRTSSTTSDRSPYCNHVIIELGNLRNKPRIAPTTAGLASGPPVQQEAEQGATVYTNISNTSN